MPNLEGPCWLCRGLGAVAIHKTATTSYLGGALWVAVEPGTASTARGCPACDARMLKTGLTEAIGELARIDARLAYVRDRSDGG